MDSVAELNDELEDLGKSECVPSKPSSSLATLCSLPQIISECRIMPEKVVNDKDSYQTNGRMPNDDDALRRRRLINVAMKHVT